MNISTIRKYSNQELLDRLDQIIGHEKKTTASLVLHLSEVDRRKLFLKEGYASLYAYLIEKYHYEGGSAYRRIQAARFLRKYPEAIELLVKGKISLMTMCLISPHITQENKNDLIKAVMGRSKQEVEDIIQLRFGKKPEVLRDKIRRLPIMPRQKETVEEIPGRTSTSGGAKNRQSSVISDASLIQAPQKEQKEETPKERREVKVEFVADEIVAKKLKRAQDLLKHKYPRGRFEDIIHEALDLLLEKKDPERKEKRISKRKFGTKKNVKSNPKQPKPSFKRYIPLEIKQQVWLRDQGKCQYKSPVGRQCEARGGLELDHVKPFALGGKHTLDNLRLLCMQHNRWRAEQTYGKHWNRQPVTSSELALPSVY